MRKTVLLVATIAALLALGTGAVLAQGGPVGTTKGDGASAIKASGLTIQCRRIPCVATDGDDLVRERIGEGKRDRILLNAGDDQVRADDAGNDRDVIRGSLGSDLIYVDDGDRRDRIFGGRDNNKCFVDAHSEVVSGCTRIIVVR